MKLLAYCTIIIVICNYFVHKSREYEGKVKSIEIWMSDNGIIIVGLFACDNSCFFSCYRCLIHNTKQRKREIPFY